MWEICINDNVERVLKMNNISIDDIYVWDRITGEKVRLVREAYQGFYILINSREEYRTVYQLNRAR